MSWQVERAGPRLTLSRPGRARLDISVSREMPAPASRARLAHQIRQDLWRALRDVRGFSPVIVVEHRDLMACITAGGWLLRPAPPGTASRIARLLDDPGLRRRWLAQAGNTQVRTNTSRDCFSSVSR
ncbi:MAG: hypothetical protein AAGI50_12795 [Pseudomonadota bacterium]